MATPNRGRAKRPHLTIDTLSSAAAAAPSPARSVGTVAASGGTPGAIPASPSTQASMVGSSVASSLRGGKSPAAASAVTLDDGSHQRRKTSLQLASQLIPPSPSRSRLDPQYSARLSAQQQGGAAGIGGGSLFNPPGIVRGYSSAASTPSGHAGHMSPFRPPAVSTASPRVSHSEPASLYGTPVASTAAGGAVGAGSLYETPRRRPQSARGASPSSRSFFGTPTASGGRRSGSYASSPAGTPRASPRSTPRRQERITGGTCDTGYSDRFIPSRVTSNLSFSVFVDPATVRRFRPDPPAPTSGEPNHAADAAVARTRTTADPATQQPILNMLLRSELLGENVDPTPAPTGSPGRSPSASSRGRGDHDSSRNSRRTPSSANGSASSSGGPLGESVNFLRFQSPRQSFHEQVFGSVAGSDGPTSVVNSFNLSPVGSVATQRLLSTPQKRTRRISKVPFKVLDAPALADDFYLNLVDWSSQNVLAVGLGTCVYLWSACTSKVTKLCDLQEIEDTVTSVSWSQKGSHLAIGTNKGEIQVWDTIKCEKLRSMTGHTVRVGALAWCGPTLASGSRDRAIYLRDVRSDKQHTSLLKAHKQEVCGMRWSFDEPAHLASGGNDNKLLVWDIKNQSKPVHKFAEHTAAVKAIAWSPHQHGLLASGGGTADRCIRFWNTLSGASLNCIDTGSQVCNLAFSKNCNEIVSTHGYSLNQIVVWKYPSMSKVATLTGHTYRVLYLAMSPDGSTIVTGAGDETLRFWQVFPGPQSDDKTSATGILFPSRAGSCIR
jgi:cell division cycle 20-like protein 1 (cofactor of APC complex)